MFGGITRRVLQPEIFGLDISDLTIKFAKVDRGKNQVLLDYCGEVEIPEGIIIGGEIKSEKDLASILKDGLRTADGRKVNQRYCVASLPEEKSFVRVIELPSVKREDLARAIRWEVEGVIPMRLDEIYYDFSPISLAESGDHIDVLITAFPRGLVDSYSQVLKTSDFRPMALELESQAISRAIISADLGRSALVIVDVGATRTSFIIFVQGSVIFTKTIGVGGRDFEAAISNALKVSREEARRIKIEVGLSKNYRSGAVFDALAPLVDSITAELKQELEFYANFPSLRRKSLPDIEKVVLCGGDANLVGLEKHVSTTIKKLTVIGNPFSNFRLPPGVIPPVPKNKSLKYSTAIGLALRGDGIGSQV